MIGDACKINGEDIGTSDAALIKRYDLYPRPLSFDIDYTDAPQITKLSEYKEASISYIAG